MGIRKSVKIPSITSLEKYLQEIKRVALTAAKILRQ